MSLMTSLSYPSEIGTLIPGLSCNSRATISRPFHDLPVFHGNQKDCMIFFVFIFFFRDRTTDREVKTAVGPGHKVR